MIGVFAAEVETGIGSLGLDVCLFLSRMRLYYLKRKRGVDEESRKCCPSKR